MNKKKIVSLCLVLALAITAAIGGTMAYFTDTDAQTNTFTAGKVGIDLDEAVVTPDNDDNLIAKGEERTEDGQVQNYELHPGQTVTKDPTITVDSDSKNAYVAAIVTVKGNIYDLIGVEGYDNIDITKLASGGLMNATATQVFGWNELDMVYETADCVIYQKPDKANNTWTLYVFVEEAKAADAEVVLFDTLTIPTTWDNAEMAKINGMNIQVDAYAVQEDGFHTCFDAMTTAFGEVFAF